jgi:hypothetical protein
LVGAREWAELEFGGSELGDARRSRRLVKLAGDVALAAGKSLPEAARDWAALKAAYRLMDSERATFEGVIGPHLEKTREECLSGGEFLIVEDTTSLSFNGRRAATGLGPLGEGGGQGLWLHSALALRIERWTEKGVPEVTVRGLLGQTPWARGDEKVGDEKWRRIWRARESERWAAALDGVDRPGEGCRWTLVADREGDIFRVFSLCRMRNVEWIIRASQARRTEKDGTCVFDAVASSPALGRFKLDVRSRPGVAARRATVELRAARVILPPPRPQACEFEPEEVAVVEAREVEARAGVEPVRWVLLTSWRVESFEEAFRVVKAYSRRWLIEEYHKALKTGAGIERSQLQTRERLEALLGVYSVVAVRLLNMKLMCAHTPEEPPPEGVLPGPAMRILEKRCGRPAEGWTNGALLTAIARLGGFLARKSDGRPGWITIWRGWRKLMIMLEGLEALA